MSIWISRSLLSPWHVALKKYSEIQVRVEIRHRGENLAKQNLMWNREWINIKIHSTSRFTQHQDSLHILIHCHQDEHQDSLPSMWGCAFSRTNADSEWPRNPAYKAFIEFIVLETKQFVGSNVNVILTRQTCSQRSSTAATGRWKQMLSASESAVCS